MLPTLFRTTIYVHVGPTDLGKQYFYFYFIIASKKQLIHTKNENKRKIVFVTTLHNNPPTHHLCRLSLIITSDLKQRKECRCTVTLFLIDLTWRVQEQRVFLSNYTINLSAILYIVSYMSNVNN